MTILIKMQLSFVNLVILVINVKFKPNLVYHSAFPNFVRRLEDFKYSVCLSTLIKVMGCR